MRLGCTATLGRGAEEHLRTIKQHLHLSSDIPQIRPEARGQAAQEHRYITAQVHRVLPQRPLNRSRDGNDLCLWSPSMQCSKVPQNSAPGCVRKENVGTVPLFKFSAFMFWFLSLCDSLVLGFLSKEVLGRQMPAFGVLIVYLSQGLFLFLFFKDDFSLFLSLFHVLPWKEKSLQQNF